MKSTATVTGDASEFARAPGISTEVFAGRLEPRTHLPAAAAAGFAALELSLLSGPERFDHSKRDAVTEFGDRAADLGLAVWSVHEPEIGECLGAESALEQNRAADQVRRCLEVAHRLGAVAIPSHLLMNQMLNTDPEEEAEIERRLVDRLHQLAPEVRASGARIAFENTGRRAWARPAALQRRMATLPADAYGFVLDTGHSNLMSDMDELLDAFGARLLTLHLDDNHGESDDHLPPLEGTTDWDAVRARLDQLDYQGCLLYEVGTGADSVQTMAATMAAHVRIFGDR